MAGGLTEAEELELLELEREQSMLSAPNVQPQMEQALGERAERLNRGRTFPSWMKGAPQPLSPENAKNLAAEELGVQDALTLRFGDEIQGLYDPEGGKQRSDMINYAQETRPEHFQRGEIAGTVGNVVATSPFVLPRALNVASKLPMVGPVAKTAIGGALSGLTWDTLDQMGAGEGNAVERFKNIDTDRSKIAGGAGAVLGGTLGALSRPLNNKQQQVSTVLDGVLDEGAVTPDGLRTFDRFLRDNGLTLNDIPRDRINELIESANNLGSDALSLPIRLKDVLVEEFEGLRNPIQRQLRGTSGSGDQGADIIHKAIDEDLPEARNYLKGSLENTLGDQSRLSAMDDIQGRLTEIGREGYEPLLRSKLTPEGEAALAQVLEGPGMNKLYEPLRTVAAGEGLDLDRMLQDRPLEAAHWMQSKARQLADRSSDAVVSNAMGSLRNRLLSGLNEATGGQYDVVRRQYGDEFGNLQALEFGDRFLTRANKDLDVDLMAREYAELSPSQKEAALLSVRDAIQSSTGRGRATAGPRLTKVREEQVLTALPKVFGEDGDKITDLIQQTDDFVSSRRAIDTRSGSQTAPLGEDIEFAQNTAIRPLRRKVGNLVRDAATDIGVSTAFGNAVPFRLLRSGGKSLGDFIGGDPNRKMNELAKLLEARIDTAKAAQAASMPPGSAAPSSGNAAGLPNDITPEVTPTAAVAASRGERAGERGMINIDGKPMRRKDALKQVSGDQFPPAPGSAAPRPRVTPQAAVEASGSGIMDSPLPYIAAGSGAGIAGMVAYDQMSQPPVAGGPAPGPNPFLSSVMGGAEAAQQAAQQRQADGFPPPPRLKPDLAPVQKAGTESANQDAKSAESARRHEYYRQLSGPESVLWNQIHQQRAGELKVTPEDRQRGVSRKRLRYGYEIPVESLSDAPVEELIGGKWVLAEAAPAGAR
jgi:hypothetical protein